MGGGASVAGVYVFRQDSLIRGHEGLLDHPFQPDLPYNTVRRVSLLVRIDPNSNFLPLGIRPPRGRGMLNPPPGARFPSLREPRLPAAFL